MCYGNPLEFQYFLNLHIHYQVYNHLCLQKKRIECAIMIQAELEQAGIDGSIPVALG